MINNQITGDTNSIQTLFSDKTNGFLKSGEMILETNGSIKANDIINVSLKNVIPEDLIVVTDKSTIINNTEDKSNIIFDTEKTTVENTTMIFNKFYIMPDATLIIKDGCINCLNYTCIFTAADDLTEIQRTKRDNRIQNSLKRKSSDIIDEIKKKQKNN